MNGLSLHVVVALLLAGCAHAPLDTAEIDAAAVDARNRVNELAEELTELATPIMMFCGLVGDEDAKCEALRSAYDVGRSAVITAQRYIDAFAQTGQGLAIVEAGVTVIEAAVQDVRAETERVMEELQDAVASAGDTGNEDSGAGSGSDPATGGQPSAGEVAEGEGSAVPAGEAAENAREERAPAGGEGGGEAP